MNLRSPTGEQPRGDGKKGKKASGLLMVDGVLFLWVRNAGNAQLAWSATTPGPGPGPTGPSRPASAARHSSTSAETTPCGDDDAYVYSHDSDSAYKPADRLVLSRVPKDRIALRRGL